MQLLLSYIICCAVVTIYVSDTLANTLTAVSSSMQNRFMVPPLRTLNAPRILKHSSATMDDQLQSFVVNYNKNVSNGLKPSFSSDIRTSASVPPSDSLDLSALYLSTHDSGSYLRGSVSMQQSHEGSSLYKDTHVFNPYVSTATKLYDMSLQLSQMPLFKNENLTSSWWNVNRFSPTKQVPSHTGKHASNDLKSDISDNVSTVSFIDSGLKNLTPSLFYTPEFISAAPLTPDKKHSYTSTFLRNNQFSDRSLPISVTTSQFHVSYTNAKLTKHPYGNTFVKSLLIKPTTTFNSISFTRKLFSATVQSNLYSTDINFTQGFISKHWSVGATVSNSFLSPTITLLPSGLHSSEMNPKSSLDNGLSPAKNMFLSGMLDTQIISTTNVPLKTNILQSSVTVSPLVLTSNFSTSANTAAAVGLMCSQMKLHFPENIEIDESEEVGTVLASMPIVTGSGMLNFSVEVAEPSELTNIMKGYFAVQVSGSEFSLTMLRKVDIEQLYHLTQRRVPVKDLLLKVHCTERYHNTAFEETFSINMTVWDEDDEMPRFENQDGDSTCVVPVYKADASEDYMGELTVKPGKIVAVDGDLFVKHNISYAVMHAEPENYDVYFYLNTVDGSVNKTKQMNASDPRKYVLFIQAMEDSPQQKKKVAVLSIEVFAPSDPLGNDQSTVDSTVKLSLKVISALVILGFASGFIVVAHHRWRRKKGPISPDKSEPCEIARELKLPELAVYRSSSSSLEREPTILKKTEEAGLPTISSPSQVLVETSAYQSFQKKRRVIVKKPIDTKLRPGWNAPMPKKKPVVYSPYKSVKRQ